MPAQQELEDYSEGEMVAELESRNNKVLHSNNLQDVMILEEFEELKQLMNPLELLQLLQRTVKELR
ncbi:MAG: hypothetical protein SFU21_03410 [Flavihumibacter sp.]|nr:hypothetical protein [Flavihumibacter sp.]